MYRVWLALAVALVALAGVACGADGPVVDAGSTSAGDTTASTLDGRTFLSTSVSGHDLVSGSQVRLSFDLDMLLAGAGCNTMRGPFSITDSVLQVDAEMATTMMACEPDLMAQDEWLAEFLADGPVVEADGDRLTLTGGGASVQLLDEQVADRDLPLVETRWVLSTILDGVTASSVPTGVEPPTFHITEQGEAQIFTGCNQGGGAVGVNGPTLSFGSVLVTQIACDGDTATVEQAVLVVLDGDVEFTIDGSQLTLTKGDRGLVYEGS